MDIAGALYEYHGLRRDAFSAPDGAEMIGGGGFDGDVPFGDPDGASQGASHLRDEGGKPGFLCDDGCVDVSNVPAPIAHHAEHGAEQVQAAGIFEPGVARWEVGPEISERRGAQEGIHEGMGQDVGIRIAGQSTLMRHVDAAQAQGPAGFERVNVETRPDPDFRHSTRR